MIVATAARGKRLGEVLRKGGKEWNTKEALRGSEEHKAPQEGPDNFLDLILGKPN